MLSAFATTNMPAKKNSSSRPVVIWLIVVYVFILAMIVLGGVTRLTESGLSIVKWEPVLGVLPPMNDAQWHERFQAYKSATGQAAVLFSNLTVEQFKPLFLWEFVHRLVGRLTGFVVAIPFVILLLKRRIGKSLAIKIASAFVFGGLQGGVGWLMVATGLQQDMTHVSHYALAAHLVLALTLMSFIVWLILDLLPAARSRAAPRWSRAAAFVFIAVLVLQIIYGAFTAGLRAGHFFNTFPTMNGMWIPPGTFGASPMRDLLANPMTVQWTHRLLAWLLAGFAAVIWIGGLKSKSPGRSRATLHLVLLFTLLQSGLGIATLLLNVPVWLGALHQFNAALLLTAAVALLQTNLQHKELCIEK